MGFDLADPLILESLQAGRTVTRDWDFGTQGSLQSIVSPSNGQNIGQVRFISPQQAKSMIEGAQPWSDTPQVRAGVLQNVADLYEQNADELFALLTHEAGKTLIDCIGEVREAVDFFRYYAEQAKIYDASANGFSPVSVLGIFH